MVFAVTYRNKLAQRETVYIDAEDRSDCFRILNERQINAISVNVCDKKPSASKRLLVKGTAKRLVTVIVVVAIALLSFFYFNLSYKSNDATLKKRKSSTVAVDIKKKESPKPEALKEAKAAASTVVKDKTDEAVTTNAPAETVSPSKKFRLVKNRKRKVFHTISDVYISRILNTRPGHAVIGTMNYDRFEEQFKKSLATPIVITKDDTPSEVAMKQAVIETRKELKAALNRGEDIAQMMRDSESELRKLYNYRQTLNAELSKAMRERKYNAEDMQCYIDAANKMLSDNGLAPLKHPQLWIRQLQLEQAEKSEKE